MPWIGVDLDGTLASGSTGAGDGSIGAPVPAIVALVKGMLKQGLEVRIFTARAAAGRLGILPVKGWIQGVFGVSLPVTNVKTLDCLMILDDRAISIMPDQGRLRTLEEQTALLNSLSRISRGGV